MPTISAATPSIHAHGWSVHAPYANASSRTRLHERNEPEDGDEATQEPAARRRRDPTDSDEGDASKKTKDPADGRENREDRDSLRPDASSRLHWLPSLLCRLPRAGIRRHSTPPDASARVRISQRRGCGRSA